ncbi:Flowering time control protein FCA [Acorus gramineus]|uniref:Flowering time control protein FCA n=1 Tax=Acorus gramineus TaxID=55184 RepID=A0AAV9BRJ1_ACOGR|nr:Flowering time control protein FCA [Acorus gramineus]
MAEAEKGSDSSGGGGEGESVKLFVGQVPKHMTEAQLLAMFKEVAIVDEVNIIKDKATKVSRGCCFLICPSREEADKAVSACHNKRTLPGYLFVVIRNLFSLSQASSPLQVKYADGELERLEHKLFVGMLPKNVSDAEVSALFSQYGNIKDLQILRGSPRTSKAGCAFLKYETKEQALAALEALNGKYKMEGSSVPLVIKWADTEKEREARKAQKTQSWGSNVPHTSPAHQPSLFGALPMGYLPPYNGFGYQPGTYGFMHYPMQNRPGFHNLIPPGNQGNVLHGGPPAFPALPGFQYPLPYPGGMMSNRPLGNSHGAAQPVSMSSDLTNASTISNSSITMGSGPPDANLFIYHIPQEFGDQELSNAFQAFGRVLSAKVFVDKATGVSKCFGFVSYDSPTAAQCAINMMNGSQLGGKKLKVQLKRDNKQSKPY